MTYTATYSPEDNKLRLYSSTRLDRELYARVRRAGFIYAPKQELFVAPMWTPEREDFLIELCGEIDDEDKSLVERAEEFGRVAPLGLNERLYLASNHCYTQPHAFPQS